METCLYEYALMLDPVGAQMVMIALEDGVIDLAAAELAWCAIAAINKNPAEAQPFA